MKTICLNMIVKNENHVIRRCLEAIKPIIDYWVIVDTGSTDGTQETIKECLRGYPGELHERPWKNFAHNRNEALQLASRKMEYLLFVDADEILHFASNFHKDALKQGYYLIKVASDSECLYSPKLVLNDSRWEWLHVLHEFVQHDGYLEGEILKEIWIESVQDGARSKDPDKIQNDIAILKKAIQNDPLNARYYFYLAQTYVVAKDFNSALKTYQIRSTMEGDRDETFWALFCIGMMQEKLHMSPTLYLKSYDEAHQFDPSRAEPLERAANYYFQNNCFSIAYCIMKEVQKTPMPAPLTSGYFDWVYDFAAYSVLADCAMKLGKLEEAKELYQKILGKPKSPKGLEAHIHNQLRKIENYLQNKLPSAV